MGPDLRGRRREREALEQLVVTARAGRSGVIVVRGEAGVGKTALLEDLAGRATACHIARVVGVESEGELAFAGLHQLCAPMLERLDRLPGPQRAALGTAFGLEVGASPDRFLVGLAVLNLLADAAEAEPVVCLVDDIQWMDRISAQTLAFVARRLLAERVALVFAVREPTELDVLGGLPELILGGLDQAAAGALLEAATVGRLDGRVRDRIVAETRGNPLALLEVARAQSPAGLAGGVGAPDTVPVASRIEEGFVRQVEAQPPDTRRVLLVAAVESVGDASILWRALDQLGISRAAADPAIEAGLLEIGAGVRFRHPLVRSAVCRAADAGDLREAHRALTAATDPRSDPDRRAWHRAQAAAEPDEEVASELERSAGRAQARGGVAAAAAFLARATELTPDPSRRGGRALAAAQAKYEAAANEEALTLVAEAARGPLDELQLALLDRLRAKVSLALRRPQGVAAALAGAGRRLERFDAALARESYLVALGAGMVAGRLGDADELREAAALALAAPLAPDTDRVRDLLLHGLAVRFADGHAAAVGPLRQALDAIKQVHGPTENDLRWVWMAAPAGPDLWDDEAWHDVTEREVRFARGAGTLLVIPLALNHAAAARLHAGDMAGAAALVAEADAIGEATGSQPVVLTALELAAWRGRDVAVEPILDAVIRGATAAGAGMNVSVAENARATLYNGLGRHAEARVVAERACQHDDFGLLGWGLLELIEAAARDDHLDMARDAVRRLAERTQVVRTDWALGVEAWARAQVADGDHADALCREAVERLARTRVATHLARAQLLYGEQLRRAGGRADARVQLRAALDAFTRMGAEGFASRTVRELVAMGDTADAGATEEHGPLSPQEAHVARLAVAGLTNSKIGAELFISPRTVEWHLHNVFTKLAIASRRELRGAMSHAGLAIS